MNSRSDWRCSKAYNETAFRVFVLDRVCMSQRFSAFDWWFYVETVPGSFARFLIFLFISIFTSIWRSFDGSFSPTFLHFAFPQHICISQWSSIWFVILRPKPRFSFFLISVNIKFFRKIFFNLFVFYVSSIYLHTTMILHSIRDFTWKRYFDRSSEFSFYSSVTLLLPYNVLSKDHFLFFDHLAFRISPIYLHITTIRVFISKPYLRRPFDFPISSLFLLFTPA